MRLIDGDALKRKMQKVATEAWKMKLNAPIETTFNQCIDYIDSAPTIDLVRCKECEFWKENTEFCAVFSDINKAKRMLADDFCSLGLRKGTGECLSK